MAESPERVIEFLEDLARRARPYAEKDLAELRAFAKDELGIDDMQAWDATYASEKLREKRYAFSAQEVKQYFPEPKVVAGLFGVISKLFGVTIAPDQAPVWHPDVRFFRIERDGQLIGQFYLDLYARPGKGQGAWMDDARGRRLTTGGIVQTPIAYLTCNFTPPAEVDGQLQPSLFTHDEVTTLFHEFGHGLHHMLTEVDELSVSGISGVEWDAVELPSQFMENFCWEWDVLQGMTAHVKTGEPLPRELYEKMLAAKNFQSGMQTLRQVEFSLIDMHLHYDFDPNSQKTVQELVDEVRSKFSVLIPPSFNRFQHSFGHIFAGGYAAGYYSYKWAEVLSADAYAAFEEAAEAGGSALDETGKRFHQEILSVGGSRPALESFKAFRGREPQIDALLRHNGMQAA
jgi:oligopeptidase A